MSISPDTSSSGIQKFPDQWRYGHIFGKRSHLKVFLLHFCLKLLPSTRSAQFQRTLQIYHFKYRPNVSIRLFVAKETKLNCKKLQPE